MNETHSIQNPCSVVSTFFLISHHWESVPSLSLVWLFATPWTAAHSFPCPSLSPEVWSISCPFSQWCYPTILSLSSPALSLSQNQGFFTSEPALHIRWPKYWSFSRSISPLSEYSGLISFQIDWFDLLAVQGTLKSSPTPRSQSINSSVLSFLYGTALTSIHDSWKNHSFNYAELCWQSNVSAF